MYAFDEIKKADSEIADAIQAEMKRQNSHLELIASENWVAKQSWQQWEVRLQINTQKAIRANVTMVDVSVWM